MVAGPWRHIIFFYLAHLAANNNEIWEQPTTKRQGIQWPSEKPMLDKQMTERNDLCGRISEIDPPCQIILEMCNAAAKPDFWERCFFFKKYSCKDLRSCLRHLNHRTKRVMFIMMVIMWWWYQIWDWISRLMLRRFVPIKEWCCINTKRKLKMMSGQSLNIVHCENTTQCHILLICPKCN